MHSITASQNSPEMLKLLRAQRSVYSSTKVLLIQQVCLTVILPVLAAIAVLKWPGLKATAATTALLVVIIDATLLDRIQKKRRRLAATIQEEFDCGVLRLPWNEFSVAKRPDPEIIHEAAGNFRGNETEVTNWYPAAVDKVPLHLARVIAQRTNSVYDSKLRRRFGNWTRSSAESCVEGVLLG